MAGAGRVAAQVVEVILLIGLQFQAAIKISFNIERLVMGNTLERPFFSLSLSLICFRWDLLGEYGNDVLKYRGVQVWGGFFTKQTVFSHPQIPHSKSERFI